MPRSWPCTASVFTTPRTRKTSTSCSAFARLEFSSTEIGSGLTGLPGRRSLRSRTSGTGSSSSFVRASSSSSSQRSGSSWATIGQPKGSGRFASSITHSSGFCRPSPARSSGSRDSDPSSSILDEHNTRLSCRPRCKEIRDITSRRQVLEGIIR